MTIPACAHDYRAACWICSDERPWYREARLRAGYGSEPPNLRPQPPRRLCARGNCKRVAIGREPTCINHIEIGSL